MNKNKEKTYSETQGFTNGKLRVANTTRETQNTEATTKASQVNEGAITEYPYKIDKTIERCPLCGIALTNGICTKCGYKKA